VPVEQDIIRKVRLTASDITLNAWIKGSDIRLGTPTPSPGRMLLTTPGTYRIAVVGRVYAVLWGGGGAGDAGYGATTGYGGGGGGGAPTYAGGAGGAGAVLLYIVPIP